MVLLGSSPSSISFTCCNPLQIRVVKLSSSDMGTILKLPYLLVSNKDCPALALIRYFP